MKKKGLIRRWPVPSNGKFIYAYKTVPDMCVESVAAELKCSDAECEWLKAVTNCAGRVPRTQTLMDKYMRPRGKEVLSGPEDESDSK
jgi:hypothetical protein